MKRTAIYLFLFLFVCLFSQNIVGQNNQNSTTISIPLGGNSYQISGNNNETINENGIDAWQNPDSEFAIYFSTSTAKNVFISLDILEQKENSEIIFSTEDKSKQIKFETGNTGKIKVGEFLLKQGYNVLKLKGISKKGIDYAKIKNLVLEYEGNAELSFVKENSNNRFYWGKRGPSVHISYNLPKNKNIKWFYNEITVAVGKDPIGSYFMANGFGQGYFGIQVNSETERRILFSVWSPNNTNNPNDIPNDEKIKLLKKGDGVKSGEFGNEGAGGQSYKLYNWKAGNTYKFLNSIEPDGKGNTVYTAYFKVEETGKWILIASFLRPKTNSWYTNAHSFLENFDNKKGFKQRKVLFSNQWICDSNGEWTEVNKGVLTGDDIAVSKYRLDFEGGIENNAFYLKNGGYFNGDSPLYSVFQRQTTNIKPVVDFSILP